MPVLSGLREAGDGGVLLLAIDGQCTVDEFLDHLDKLLVEPAWKGAIPIVLDTRSSTIQDLDTHAMRRIGAYFAAHDDYFAPRRAHVTIAGIHRAFSRIGAVVARVWHDHEVAVFDDLDDAIAWALED